MSQITRTEAETLSDNFREHKAYAVQPATRGDEDAFFSNLDEANEYAAKTGRVVVDCATGEAPA